MEMMGIVSRRVFGMMCLVLVSCEREEIPRTVAVREDGVMELNLMTFNLRYENDEDVGKRAWKRRVVGIVKMVREEKLDVLGIQEGQHGQVADMRVSLSKYDFAGQGRDDGGREGEYVGIFFRKDRFEKDEKRSGMMWLSDTPERVGSMTWGNGIPRVATWVRLVDRESGQGLWVVNVHLDHRSQVSREKGVRLVAERLVRMNEEGDAVVWMGDFNAVEGNPAVRFVKGDKGALVAVKGFEGMVETYDVLNAQDRKRGTLHFWMSDPNRQWKVDHIFITRGGEVLESAILRGGEPYLSDHFPVKARVAFPSEMR
jgi:endonuclease/exonuclease/phosphatase family metal-dependent hydrolase